MSEFFVILYHPQTGAPMPLLDMDDELIVFKDRKDLDGLDNPLVAMGQYEVFEFGTGCNIEDIVEATQ